MNKEKIFGICISRVHDEYYEKMLQILYERAIRYHCKLMIFATYRDLFHQKEDGNAACSVFQIIPYHKLDGLIMFPESMKNEEIAQQIVNQANAFEIPVVSVDYHLDKCYNVKFAYSDAFEQIVRHMVEYHGYRRINLIAGVKDNPFEIERTEVYKRVLRENGIEVEEERIAYGDFWNDPTYGAIDKFLSSSIPFPQAIVCENDTMAIAACKRLSEYGIRVPEDVKITGLDGIPAALNHTPKLTTAMQNMPMAAEKIFEILLAYCNGEREQLPPQSEEQLVPFTPVFNRSCGCDIEGGTSGNAELIEAYRRWDNMMGQEEFVENMRGDIISNLSIAELPDRLKPYLLYNSWVCLRTDLPANLERMEQDLLESGGRRGFDFDQYAFTPNMRVLLQHRGEKYFHGELFAIEEVLPDFDEIMEETNALIVVPIYFVEQVFGYYALEYRKDVQLDFTRRFCNVFSSILKVIQDQEHMRLITRELQRKNQELNELYVQDPLTKLYNRRGFYQRIQELYEEAPKDSHLVLFSIDMDGLKQVNDSFGHTEGDFALGAIANALHAMEEHWSQLVCARFGGDEFIAAGFFEDEKRADKEISQFFIAHLEDCNAVSGKPYLIKASIGSIIGERTDDFDVEVYINEADTLMYQHKETKKRLSKLGNCDTYGAARNSKK